MLDPTARSPVFTPGHLPTMAPSPFPSHEPFSQTFNPSSQALSLQEKGSEPAWHHHPLASWPPGRGQPTWAPINICGNRKRKEGEGKELQEQHRGSSRGKKNVGCLWKRCVREAGKGRRRRQARTGEATQGHERDAASAGDQWLPLVLPPSSSCWAGSPLHPFLVSSALMVKNLSQPSRASGVGLWCCCCRGDILLAPALTQSLPWVCGTQPLWDPLHSRSPRAASLSSTELEDCRLQSLGTHTGCTPKALFRSP